MSLFGNFRDLWFILRRKIRIPESKVLDIINIMDRDDDGYIDLGEIVQTLLEYRRVL